MSGAESRRNEVPRRVVVIGASAGGVEALSAVVRGLSADLPAAFVVVTHIPADAESRLPAILARAGPLSARTVVDGVRLAPGTIFVAPPDRHTILSGGRLWLVDEPREHHVRPAVDPLFRSAAHQYRERAVGVILSGTGDDGTAGLAAIAAAGGTTIVQDPDGALATGMPRAAIARVAVDHVVPVDLLGPLLTRLVRESLAGSDSAGAPVRSKGAPGDGALTEAGLIEPPTNDARPASGGSPPV